GKRGAHRRHLRSYDMRVDRLAGRGVAAHKPRGSRWFTVRDGTGCQVRDFGSLRQDFPQRAATRHSSRRCFRSNPHPRPPRWRSWGTDPRPSKRLLGRCWTNVPAYSWTWSSSRDGGRMRQRRSKGRRQGPQPGRRWLQHARRWLRQRLRNVTHSWTWGRYHRPPRRALYLFKGTRQRMLQLSLDNVGEL